MKYRFVKDYKGKRHRVYKGGWDGYNKQQHKLRLVNGKLKDWNRFIKIKIKEHKKELEKLKKEPTKEEEEQEEEEEQYTEIHFNELKHIPKSPFRKDGHKTTDFEASDVNIWLDHFEDIGAIRKAVKKMPFEGAIRADNLSVRYVYPSKYGFKNERIYSDVYTSLREVIK
jgi:hypothetical protein